MKPEHETRRKIIREWMSLPKDKRQTEDEMARTRDVLQVVDENMATRSAPSRLKALSDDELWQLYEAYIWRPRDRQLDELDEAILAEIDRRAKLPSQSSA